MYLGIPGGSPGPGAQSGCVGLVIVAIVSLIAVSALVWLLLRATGLMGVVV
jgi:hypothetical protein